MDEAPPDLSPHLVPPRYLSADVPGLGGRIKERAEDFLVDEVPLYEPSGEGEHIYMLVEKADLSTFQAQRILATHFGVRPMDVGFAGMKDRRALTRQVFSIHAPGRKIEDFPTITHHRLKVHWVDYHNNKLRRGHLKGNRFSIRIRGIPPTGVVNALKVLRVLEKSGVPNRIGEQRFSALERNHLIGRALILGRDEELLDLLLGPSPERPDLQQESRAAYAARDFVRAIDLTPRGLRTEQNVLRMLARGRSPHQAVARLEPHERSFFVSAFQSAVFNAVLDARTRAGTLDTLAPGDIAVRIAGRESFPIDEETLARAETAERLASFEISPSGPMWGVGMRRASGGAAETELNALLATGVTPDDLAAYENRHSGEVEGDRRPLRIRLEYPDAEGGVDEHGSYVRVAFELPRGSFATAVLREIMKPDQAAIPGNDDESHD